MNKKYAVVIKTGDAEMRAVSNLPDETLSKFLPIIELTRGRKIREKDAEEIKANIESGKERYPLDKRLERIKEIFKGQTICLDLTATASLSNNRINDLYDCTDGYKKWVDFLVKLKDENIFKEIIPCIIMDVEDPNFEVNLSSQITQLCSVFKNIVYRNELTDEYCYDDIKVIKNAMINGANLIYLLDSTYIVTSSYLSYQEKIDYRITKMSELLPLNTKCIICGTSFPKQVSDVGNDYTDTFILAEKVICNFIKERHSSIEIIYGDYGTINPIRNDEVVMARGWIPRIDVPTIDEVYYYRIRRPKGVTEYIKTYIEVGKLVKTDPRYPAHLKSNWGIKEINRCADGKPSASSPGFWISVRMNIHIQQQVNQL